MSGREGPAAAPGRRRQPNPRGEGGRLRDELVEAAIDIVEEAGGHQVTLRRVAKRVGVAATSVYLHFPDMDHLLAAVVRKAFDDLSAATAVAAQGARDPADEVHRRCQAYCRFALSRPRLYQVMFQGDLPALWAADPSATPGRASFERLVTAVRQCIAAGVAPPHDDPFRLASLIWTAEHGIALARMARPTFPWAPMEALVDEMVDRLLGIAPRL